MVNGACARKSLPMIKIIIIPRTTPITTKSVTNNRIETHPQPYFDEITKTRILIK